MFLSKVSASLDCLAGVTWSLWTVFICDFFCDKFVDGVINAWHWAYSSSNQRHLKHWHGWCPRGTHFFLVFLFFFVIKVFPGALLVLPPSFKHSYLHQLFVPFHFLSSSAVMWSRVFWYSWITLFSGHHHHHHLSLNHKDHWGTTNDF